MGHFLYYKEQRSYFQYLFYAYLQYYPGLFAALKQLTARDWQEKRKTSYLALCEAAHTQRLARHRHRDETQSVLVRFVFLPRSPAGITD